jgi:tetratricopeptide (TPR) repeat protein
MALSQNRLPLAFIVALVVILLTPSWIAAQGSEDCFKSNCHSARADWQQRLWYADIYSFLYGDCDCYYARHGLYYPPYAGARTDTSAAALADASADTSASGAAANSADGIDSSKSNEEDPASLMDSANVLYLTGSYEQASLLYAKAVNLDPTLSKGWLNLGNCLFFLGRYQASLEAYNALLSREPDNANALTGKNNALSALERANATQI